MTLADRWGWSLTLVYDEWRRLFVHELARQWGEATWTARDLWDVRS